MSQIIDWPGIRAAAVALNSVRDAAMRAASQLPPIEQQRFVERVNKRAYRERWLDQARDLSKPRDNGALPLSKSVQTGSDSLVNALREHGNATKLALSKATRRGAEHLAESNPVAIVEHHHALRNITAAGSQLHGWEAKSGPAANVMVNIALLGVEPGSVTVQGEIVDCDSEHV